MSNGETNDDGYRDVHVYFQKDHHHYPIEIQFNTFYDRQFNDWLHDKFYKRGYDKSIGQILRKYYEDGKIKSVEEFEEVLAISRPTAYGEYEPYRFVYSFKEFEREASKL